MTDVEPAPGDGWSAHLRPDLRTVALDDVLDRVERSLGLRLERGAAARKRRTIGARSDRGTWVRVECRGVERDTGQGWGLEAARVVRGIPAPQWFAGVSWFDRHRHVLWRADEIEFVDEPPIGRATAARDLPESWWIALANARVAVRPARQPSTASRLPTAASPP